MKKLLVLAVGALLLSGVAVAQTGIDNSKHDLGANDADQRICIFCHVPHNGNPNVPLWNHSLTTSTYQVYTSATLNATLSGTWASGSISKLCMGCHDGTVGRGDVQHDSRGGITDPGVLTGDANLGTDLRNDHPVAFTYQSAIDGGDSELKDPFSPTAGVQLFGAGSDQVECASCHDVHDPQFTPFLVDNNTNSAICFACHDK